MTPPDVSDAAVLAGIEAFNAEIERQLTATKRTGPAIRSAIAAAMGAMLIPVGRLPDHAMQRLTIIGRIGWDDLFTLEPEVADAHTVYVLRTQENADG